MSTGKVAYNVILVMLGVICAVDAGVEFGFDHPIWGWVSLVAGVWLLCRGMYALSKEK